MRNILLLIIVLLIPAVIFADGWEQLQGGPSARYGHSMVKIGNNVYVYGGTSTTALGDILNDLWQYDESNATWEELQPTNPPEGRKFHAAAAANGKMYVFAGKTETTGVIQDIWEYDPQANSWQQKESGGPQVPLPRIYHRAASVENKVWITGGLLSSQIFDDIWCYDVTTQQWEKETSFSTPRYGHLAGYYGGNIIIHGGAYDAGFRNDMLSYNIATKQWTTVQTQGTAPQNTKFSASAWEANVLWVSGGTTKDSNGNYPEVKTTYEYNMETKQWTQKADGPASDLGTAVQLGNSQSAGSKAQQTGSTDAAYTVLTFGGSRDGLAINEVWKYTSQVLTAITTIGTIEGYKLEQNYPNPFNPTTTISYKLDKDSDVEINIFDISGKLITTLHNEYQTQGEHSITWNGTGDSGIKVGGGVYFFQIQADDFVQTKKMVLMK